MNSTPKIEMFPIQEDQPEVMFHVFGRTMDPRVDYNKKYNEDLFLIKTFISEGSAIKWILDKGQNIIELEKENRNDPIVLTIIPSTFETNDEYYPGDSPFHFHEITNKHYFTFSFSDEGYNMLIEELMYDLNQLTYEHFTPFWIRYLDSESNIMEYGIKKEDFLKIQRKFTYYIRELEQKTQDTSNFDKFKSDPETYIANMRRVI